MIIHIFKGRRCDQCNGDSYKLQNSGGFDCTPCNCDYQGSLNSSCDPISGQCYCQVNVTGRMCDRCITGYYAGSDDMLQKKGCTLPCDCDPMGSVDMGENGCGIMDGQCWCKSNVQGRKCDQCKEGSYKLELANIQGCTPCECNPAGTLNGTRTCDLATGKCTCKPHVKGDQCTECMEGYFGLSEKFADGCYPCECHPDGSKVNDTCHKVTGQCDCREGGNITMAGTKCVRIVFLFQDRFINKESSSF